MISHKIRPPLTDEEKTKAFAMWKLGYGEPYISTTLRVAGGRLAAYFKSIGAKRTAKESRELRLKNGIGYKSVGSHARRDLNWGRGKNGT